MLEAAKIAALVAALGYIAVAGLMFTVQRRLMYLPDATAVAPSSVGLAAVEHTLATPDGARLRLWHAGAAPGQPTLLYLHGNAGNLATRAARMAAYLSRGRGMAMLSWRSYGGSTGSPSEAANVADALLAYDWLIGRGVAPSDILIYGESLGSGVAVQVAARRAVGGVVLDAPYTAIVDVAAAAYPWLPVRWLLLDRYETLRHLPGLNAPLLVIHGERDDVIPVAMGRAVHAAAPVAKKRIVTFPLAGHADHAAHGSFQAVDAWIDEVRGTGSPSRRVAE